MILGQAEPRQAAAHVRDRPLGDVGAVVVGVARGDQLAERAVPQADLEHLLAAEILGHVALEVRVEAEVELVEAAQVVLAAAGDPACCARFQPQSVSQKAAFCVSTADWLIAAEE